MKDTRRHYPKEIITWGILPGVWKTAGTICGKRRAVDCVTDNPELLTCMECVKNALDYWTKQRDTCTDLIAYAETGQLRGTSAEKESESLVPKLRTALDEAITTITALSHRIEIIGKG